MFLQLWVHALKANIPEESSDVELILNCNVIYIKNFQKYASLLKKSEYIKGLFHVFSLIEHPNYDFNSSCGKLNVQRCFLYHPTFLHVISIIFTCFSLWSHVFSQSNNPAITSSLHGYQREHVERVKYDRFKQQKYTGTNRYWIFINGWAKWSYEAK